MSNIIRSCRMAKVPVPGQRYFEYRVSIITFGAVCCLSKSSPIPTEINLISIPQKKPCTCRPPTQKFANFDHTRTKRGELIFQLKPKPFPAEHKNQVNFENLHKSRALFDPPLENEVILGPQTKTCQFRPPTQNQVNFDPPHKNQVIFGPNTKNKAISTHTGIR